MSTTTIQIGDGGGAYIFDVPPEFTPAITTLRNAQGERIGETHTWPVRGYLRGAGLDNVNTLYNALRLKLKTEQVNVYFKHGDTVLQQILASQTERGPRFDGPSIESGSDTCWDSNLLFSFEITADIYDIQDGVIDIDYSITHRENEDGSFARTKSGTVRTTYGVSAYSAAQGLAPTVPPGYKLASSSITPGKDDTEADFSFTLESLFSSLPDEVLIAERTVSESVENGVKTTTYTATFTGSGAERAAREYEPKEGAIIARSLSRSEDSNSLSVTYTIRDSLTGTPRLSYRNAISIEKSVPECNAFKSDGADPILFEGASTEATIRESGEVVYKGEIPPEVEPLSCPGLFLRSSATTVRPETTTEDGAPATYLRDWHYTYIAASNEDLSAALKQLYGRLDSQSELR